MEKLLSRVKNIIFSPKSEWQVIKAEQTTLSQIIFNYAAVLIGVSTVAFMIGIAIFGMSMMGKTMRYSLGGILALGIVKFVLTIVGVIIAGMVINSLAPKFESKKNSIQALKVVVYSSTPGWVAGILSVIPALRVLVLLASLYGIYVWYLGLSPLMETPENKSTAYTIISIIAMIAVSILVFIVGSGIYALLMLSNLP
jgi:hypothetical protein